MWGQKSVGSILVSRKVEVIEPWRRESPYIATNNREAKPSVGGNEDGVSTGEIPHREASSSKALDCGTHVDASNLRLPSWYEPSKSGAFEQFFVSHFVKNYAAGEAQGPSDNYWMMQLLELISSNTDEGLRSATNAVSVVFYGKLSHSKVIEVEGYK